MAERNVESLLIVQIGTWPDDVPLDFGALPVARVWIPTAGVI